MSGFESLLKMFDLEDRLVDEKIDLEKLKLIDFQEVYRKFDALKHKSMTFLYQNLK